MQPNNPFTNPTAPGAPDPAPRPRDLEGCLVAYAPREFTPAGAPGNEQGVGTSAPRDRVTTDVIILEIPQNQRGPHQPAPGLVCFGGSPEWDQQPTPHYLVVGAPARFEGAWISNSNIVRALAPGGKPLLGEMVLGRIVRSNVGQRPFNLESVEGTPDMDRAVAIWSAIQMGQLAPQVPQPIPGAPVPAARQSTPAPAPMPPNPWANQQSTPQLTQPNLAWGDPSSATAATPHIPIQQAATNLMNGFPGATPIPTPSVSPVSPTPQPPAAPFPPALSAQGWTPETWATLNDAQKAQVLAAMSTG